MPFQNLNLKKTAMYFMAVILISTTLIPLVPVSSSAAVSVTLKVGDYVKFGSYNNEAILWRVVNRDSVSGDVALLSDRIISLKALDVRGNFHSGNADRLNYGSNYYPDSNIRQWLNSSSANSGANTIDWIQNDPSAGNLTSGGYNAYNTEKGFLANGNFNAMERGLIRTHTHKVMVAGIDGSKKDGGTANHTWNNRLSTVVQNYDTTGNFKNITDSMFLLSVKQLKEWVYDQRAILGNLYHTARPTVAAINNSNFQVNGLSATSAWNYWLNTPQATVAHYSRMVSSGGSILDNYASYGAYGIRPAFILNGTAATYWVGGTGSSTNPYVVWNGTSPNDTVAPTNITLNNDDVYEFSPVGSLVGTLTVTDNSDDSWTYSLVSGTGDTDNGDFAIIDSSLVTNTIFDTDFKSSYSVRIRVTDSKMHTFEKSFPITVLSRNTTLQANNRVLTLTFRENILNALNGATAIERMNNLKARIKLSTNANAASPTYNPLGTNDSINVVLNRLTITLAVPLESAHVQVKIESGAFRDVANNVSGDLFGNIVAADKTGPQLAAHRVRAKNKEIVLTFSEPILNGSTAATAVLRAAALKNSVTMAVDDGINPPVFAGLGTKDKVTIKDRTMTISLATALTGSGNKVRVANQALMDTTGNKSSEITTIGMTEDLEGPRIISARLGGRNREITLTFDENVTNASTAATSLLRDTALRTAITLAVNGDAALPSFLPLANTDKVTVSKNTVRISLTNPLSGKQNVIRITPGILRDELNNLSEELTSSSLRADEVGPLMFKTAIDPTNKIVTLTFSEVISNNSNIITSAGKMAALVAAVELSRNADDASPTYTQLTTLGKLVLSQNRLVITLNTALTGSNNRIRIQPDALRDEVGNKNLVTTSASFGVDLIAPTLR